MSVSDDLPADWQQQDSIGSYNEVIGTLRKLEIAKRALLAIKQAAGSRVSYNLGEHIYRTANEALRELDR